MLWFRKAIRPCTGGDNRPQRGFSEVRNRLALSFKTHRSVDVSMFSWQAFILWVAAEVTPTGPPSLRKLSLDLIFCRDHFKYNMSTVSSGFLWNGYFVRLRLRGLFISPCMMCRDFVALIAFLAGQSALTGKAMACSLRVHSKIRNLECSAVGIQSTLPVCLCTT